MIILITICLLVAAICKSQMDLLTQKYEKSIPALYGWNFLFWNPEFSWRRKWKNGNPLDGAAFWGSSTFLVFITDGWHLMQFFFNRAWQMAVCIALAPQLGLDGIWLFLLCYAAIGTVYSAIFELFYSNKIKFGR